MSESEKMPDMTALMAHRTRCQNCRRRFRTQDIITLESAARAKVFRLRCPICMTERLVVGTWQNEAFRMYWTELDREEWMHYRNAPPINSDDVLRVVQMLRTYTDDFGDVLEDPIFENDE